MNKNILWLLFLAVGLVLGIWGLGFWLGGCTTSVTQFSPEAPNVVSVYPANNIIAVPLDSQISATFDKDMDPSSINSTTFTLTCSAGAVSGTVTYDAASKIAIFIPLSPLAFSTVYTATISSAVKNYKGDQMTTAYSWSFTSAIVPVTTTVTGTVTTTTTTTTTTTIDQSLLYKKVGLYAHDQFGGAIEIGDVNGDGKKDFIVGAYKASPAGKVNAGSIYVYSGADGSLLYQKDGANPDYNFGDTIAVGDINGDGKTDFILASPAAASATGSVYVYSGANGSLLYQKDGANQNDGFGGNISVGDINGDGKADIIVAASNASPAGKSGAGSVYVYSGVDGSLLYQKDGANQNDTFGSTIAVGDINGDGKEDFIVGANYASPAGKSGAGSVYVYSGADGSLLYRKDGENKDDFFGSRVAAGDINGDGKAEYIIGAPGSLNMNASPGSVYVYKAP